MAGAREAAHFIAGPRYPLQARVRPRRRRTRSLWRSTTRSGQASSSPTVGLGPELRLGWQPPDGLIEDAVAAASAADAAVVLVNAASGEGMDRGLASRSPATRTSSWPGSRAVNPRTIVVLNTPGPVLMPWLDARGRRARGLVPGRAVRRGAGRRAVRRRRARRPAAADVPARPLAPPRRGRPTGDAPTAAETTTRASPSATAPPASAARARCSRSATASATRPRGTR